MKYACLLLLASIAVLGQNMKTPYEKGNGNQTATYQEMVAFYDALAAKFPKIQVKTYGATDSGLPLRVVFYSDDNQFFSTKNRKAVLLINNGIHPGEPDGTDATMMLMRDLAEGRIDAPKNVLIAAIQTYNLGGMLNRGTSSRANQNGPEEYGFRGNARNYDLNRDFIKADSRNAVSFQQIYHALNPDYFIDNHVSNGADYQYTFTYINTNKERLGKVLGTFQDEVVSPRLKEALLKKGIISIPYVEINGLKPELGYEAFMNSPRYATGYTSLFNTIGEVPETHMLKPYRDRVRATYENMVATINFLDKNYGEVKLLRQKNLEQYRPGERYPISWKIDSAAARRMAFKGYEAGLKPSIISGKPRVFYDRNKPYTKTIPYYHAYQAEREIVIPKFYVVPQSEWKVVEHLQRNKILLKPLQKDSTMLVQVYRISDYKTVGKPYEGHYLHYSTTVQPQTVQMKFRKGDWLISTQQPGVKYLLETLEPEAVDSFFNWNFFDSILGQKEYYSDYVFEDTGAELLKKRPELKTALELEKAKSQKFADDARAQLDWVYKHSEYYETSHLRYPIYRVP